MLMQNFFRSLGLQAARLSQLRISVRACSTQGFEAAKEKLSTLKNDPGNEDKLNIYALFKQATVGPCTTKRPGMMDFVGRAKWDSWSAVGSISQEEAKRQYIGLVESLLAAEGGSSSAETTSHGGASYQGIKYEVADHVATVTWNRPDKKNAITTQMYDDIIEILNSAAEDPTVKLVVFTGAGDYYCSGNDLSNFTTISMDDLKGASERGGELLKRFVGAFIDFPKPLVGLINGPCFGVSCTVLGLFDAVYAAESAFFHTPFSSLGQSPEGCSSYTFPRIMGTAKANEMLLFNKRVTGSEACERGLVSAVFPDGSFRAETAALVASYASFPPQSMAYSKVLVRDAEKATLHDVNARECDRLVERWQSKECLDAVMAFFTRK